MYGLDVMSVTTCRLYEESQRSETWTIFHIDSTRMVVNWNLTVAHQGNLAIFGALRHALLNKSFKIFLFLEVSTSRFDFVFMIQDLKYYGATHEDWTQKKKWLDLFQNCYPPYPWKFLKTVYKLFILINW